MNSPVQTDVLIIGAGVSGIGAACRLRRNCPQHSFLVLEQRADLGGTWDLFRYPGVRSDSDVLTFGYDFRPWRGDTVLADGPAIKRYVEDTAAEYRVLENIRFGRKVIRANWDSTDSLWQLDVECVPGGDREHYQARFVIVCTGYYDYQAGYRPRFPGEEGFRGSIVHPQHWPEDLDYDGKQVVVVGSGATAVTVVPAMAKTAARVTMLQRSPSYVITLPSEDRLSALLRRVLPERVVYRFARARNIWLARMFFKASRIWPRLIGRLVRAGVRSQLDERIGMEHFTPDYAPWDQRVCFVPDGDLFEALNDGSAAVVTSPLQEFTATGVRCASGEEIPADIVVLATGLRVQMAGGAEVCVDGEPVQISRRLVYKACMLEGVPNAALVFGYTNATWTLKVNIACDYICRLLNHMQQHGYASACPAADVGEGSGDSVFGTLSSGYVKRAADILPRQGRELPWRVLHDYPRDRRMLQQGAIEDGVLRFGPDREARGAASLESPA